MRISGGKDRDEYAYRKSYEDKTGKKLPENTVLDHEKETLAAKRDPKSKVSPTSRSKNSRSDGGVRHKGGK